MRIFNILQTNFYYNNRSMFSHNRNWRFILAVLLVFVFCKMGYSQDHLSCGIEDDFLESRRLSSVSQITEYQKFEKQFLAKFGNKSFVMDTVSVHHHVAVNDGFSKVTEEEIRLGMAEMNAFFAPANIYFISKEISYEENFLWSFDIVEERNQMLAIRSKDAINIFYTNQITQSGSRSGQFANEYGIFGSNAYGGFLTHEMGHIFGLFHPHGKYSGFKPQYENFKDSLNGFPYQVYIEGAVRYTDRQHDDNQNGIFDCLETGDEVCDTPAEALFEGEQICSAGSFEYTGDLVDYFGDKYSTDLGNIMSYNCGGGLTPGQYARIRYTFENLLYYLHCDKCNCDEQLVVNKSENYGIGSFSWAKACAEILKNEDDLKKIILDVPGNKINLENNGNIIFQDDNYYIESINGKTTISSSADYNFMDEISFVGNNMTLKNIHFKDLRGLYFYDRVNAERYEEDTYNLNIQGCIFENLIDNLRFIQVQDFNFSDNQIIDDNGITILSLKNGEISNNKFMNHDSNGLLIYEGENCKVNNNYFVNSSVGLWMQNFSNLVISENEFEGLKGEAILLKNVNSISLANNIIGGPNENEKIGNVGIRIYGEDNSDLIIESNQFQNCFNGLSMSDGSFRNVSLLRNKLFNNSGIGFKIKNVNDLDLEFNEIYNNYQGGLEVIDGTNINLKSNKLIENGNNGIEILNCKYLDIYNNEILGHSRIGVSVEDSENFNLGTNAENGNKIFNNGITGLFLSNNTDYEIKSNSIFCNGSAIQFSSNESESNLEVTIDVANSFQISGTGEIGALIEIYGNKEVCENCQFETYLGSTVVDDTGKWFFENEEIQFLNGESINAIIHSGDRIGLAKSCIKAQITPTREINETNFIQVYPNPTTEFITVFIAEPISSDIVYKIFNSIGTLVKQGNLTHGENIINLELMTGAHTIMVLKKEQAYASRIIISK